MKSSRSGLPRLLLHLVGAVLIANCGAAAFAGATCTDEPEGFVGCVPTCGPFTSCRTPAEPVTCLLWDELQPIDTSFDAIRDSTDFDQGGSNWSGNPYWYSLDIEEGYLFALANLRLSVYNLNNTPFIGTGATSLTYTQLGLQDSRGSHDFFVLRDLDAPEGNADLLAVGGVEGLPGLTVFDFTNRAAPTRIYQDWNKSVYEVYAAMIGGRAYAFAVGDLGGAGLRIYDMTAALEAEEVCLEDQPTTTCPGVHQVTIPARNFARHIDGTGDYIIVSSTFANGGGFDIYDVSTPSNPALLAQRSLGATTYGVAMWMDAGSVYAAAKIGTPTQAPSEARIYDVSCILGGVLCNPGSPIATISLPDVPLVTYSDSNGEPFLHFGRSSTSFCAPGASGQPEYLFDLSTPTTPRDITPQGSILVDGAAVSYWSWYTSTSPMGFNYLHPRRGKFDGAYFYRAAHSLLDVHLRNASDAALFRDGFELGNTSVWSATVP